MIPDPSRDGWICSDLQLFSSFPVTAMDFNGILMDFDEILMDSDGILMDFNEILMDFNENLMDHM